VVGSNEAGRDERLRTPDPPTADPGGAFAERRQAQFDGPALQNDVASRTDAESKRASAQAHIGLAPQKWRALFLKEEGSDGRPEANLYP
jgi:hypothetical protein